MTNVIVAIISLALGIVIWYYTIVFIGWAFSRSFRVKEFLIVLGQIRDEFKALNDYNAGRQS
ncbi:hypothetical protein ES705_21261 [subsurface metagenome]